jgi:hypothetical protein
LGGRLDAVGGVVSRGVVSRGAEFCGAASCAIASRAAALSKSVAPASHRLVSIDISVLHQ